MHIPIVVCSDIVICAGKVIAPVAGLSDCEDGKCFEDTNYDFINWYSVSVTAVKCAIACYMGPR